MDIKFGDTVSTAMCKKAVVVQDNRDTTPWGFPLILKAIEPNAMYNIGDIIQEKLENIIEVVEEDNRKHAIAYHLHDMLREMLRSFNQEDGIKSYEYDDSKKEFRVVFDVVEVPEDKYIGFDSY